MCDGCYDENVEHQGTHNGAELDRATLCCYCGKLSTTPW